MRLRHRLLVVILLIGAMQGCANTEPSPIPLTPKRFEIRPELAFSPSELPEAQLGQPYQATITVSDSETPVFSMALDSGELPPGLMLHYEKNDSTASIEGIPEEAGEFEFAIHAYCYGTNISGQSGVQHYKLSVKQQ